MNKITTPTDLRKFGLLTGTIFAGLFGLLLPFMAKHSMPTWPFIVMAIFWVPALVYPKSLTYVYKIWMKIGEALGFVNSRIILGILFFVLITPIGLIKRTFGKDVMGKKYEPNLKSYRNSVKVKDPKHMEKPF